MAARRDGDRKSRICLEAIEFSPPRFADFDDGAYLAAADRVFIGWLVAEFPGIRVAGIRVHQFHFWWPVADGTAGDVQSSPIFPVAQD
jgi:hypothetical protein